ncbi:hypothetical protein VHUM_00746 [Vanrija humicola]|uniref:F-box domain-containing protein n=1 Tax=Vanrija humicola TaxID=5417 RepID=A0A7D8V3R4_VANHU|nr:hypothetical protein VHUM_00746 [Vanrija humicola]
MELDSPAPPARRSPTPATGLALLPPEILAHIGSFLVARDLAPPTALLRTCRAVHGALAPAANPNLYADEFRRSYDTGAAARRLGREPTARDLAAELRTRTRGLSRLARTAPETGLSPNDLWIVYLMLIENDGKNIRRLVAPLPDGPAIDMVSLLDKFHARTLSTGLEDEDEVGYPPERVVDSLAMWIRWFLDEYTIRTPATLRSLRPYVFAAHQYELFFAPWTVLDLPTEHQHIRQPEGPYSMDENPKDRTNRVPYYGQTIEIAPPLLSHAAMLRFFGGPEDPEDPSSASAPSLIDVAADIEETDLRARPRPVLRSEVHDADFARLRACTNGVWSRGRSLSAWRGLFSGCWEGTFTFIDFQAFHDILSGRHRAIYHGPYGEQPQVWKLRETLIRPKRSTAGPRSRRGLPLRGPMTHAGFPKDMRAFSMNPMANRPVGTSPETAIIDDALARQLEALDGYEVVPESEVAAELAAGGDDGQDTGLALLVTGMGHSAWGRFIISGHVRVWDGLLYLVKEYAPFQRGQWIYRGYVLSDDLLVGRWRDTLTPEHFYGYEGTFVLTRRSAELA